MLVKMTKKIDIIKEKVKLLEESCKNKDYQKSLELSQELIDLWKENNKND